VATASLKGHWRPGDLTGSPAAALAYAAGRRALQFVFILWITSLIVFAAIYVIGDPVTQLLPVGTSQQTIDRVRHELGFDRSLIVQYGTWLGNLLQGDLGNSLRLGQPALEVVLERLPVTIALVVGATAIGGAVGVTLGVAAAFRPGRLLDNAVNALSYLVTSIAPFWLGLMLILLVAVRFDGLATSGFAWDPGHLVLPILTLALMPTGRTAQLTRSLMIAESQKQYVMTARAKGASEVRVALRHQLRNVLPPVLTVVLYDGARLFVGDALVVEVVFGLNGVGGLASVSFTNGDIYLAQAAVMLAATVVTLMSIVSDAMLARLDPRARELIIERRSL
jgi:peptide/nickel transport system permease protein